MHVLHHGAQNQRTVSCPSSDARSICPPATVGNEPAIGAAAGAEATASSAPLAASVVVASPPHAASVKASAAPAAAVRNRAM